MVGGWLPTSRCAPTSKIDLVCVPYAGGGASVYRGWVADLGPEIGVLPVQLPGHESRMREPLETRLAPIVAALHAAVCDSVQGALVLFGHSMGALIVFELARALQRLGGPRVVLLVVSGYRAPHLSDLEEPVHRLDDVELLSHLHDLAGTPLEVLGDEALCELILPIVRADFEVCETYTFAPGPALDVPVVVYRGDDDTRMSHEAAVAWEQHTTSTCTVRSFTGDHFFIHSARGELLDDLRSRCVATVAAHGNRA